MVAFTRKAKKGTIRATDINELQIAQEQRGVSLKDPFYNAVGDGMADDNDRVLACFADNLNVWVPDGIFKTRTWVPLRSNHTVRGNGATSLIYNDKSNATIDKRACLLPGNHHPGNMAGQTKYALNNIAFGDPSVTCTTAGDAANFTVGELVIVGSDTNISGVSRHAQLDKISAIAGGVITLVTPVKSAITDAKIWKINGTDGSTGTGIYAVENVIVENLGFMGRCAFATKGAAFNSIFRNLYMIDVHHFFATNMLTHVLIENLFGQWSGRYLEFAFNSHDVIARNWQGRFRPPAGLQAGEAMTLPIHLGEQPYDLLLDRVHCHVDPSFTTSSELIQLKGSQIKLKYCNFRHNGAAGSFLFSVTENSYTGFHHESISLEDCLLAAPGKARIGQVGSPAVAAENPQDVHFIRGEMNESVTSEAIRFNSGTNLSCTMRNRTGKALIVTSTAQYPMLNGYRMG